jgi:DNA-binding NarL/FixJ family response regulator
LGTTSVSVLLVDDHALVRRGFRRLLEDDPAITVVGEASDGETAVRLAAALGPRVIVMDWSMPGTNGLRALQRILTAIPDVAIVMVSVHGERQLAIEAARAGARGYVRKAAVDVDLCDVVKRVASGELVFEPALLPDIEVAAHPPFSVLSDRQREVLQLVCAGLLNRDIAERLGMSVNTVRVHRARIMKTLGVHTAGELVAYAIRHRMVDAP